MSLSYNSSIVRNGLVMHLDAGNIKSYPGTGTTWFDLSGDSNNSEIINSPPFANNVFTFDGASDRIVCPSTNIISEKDSSFSWEFWVKPTTVDTLDRFFICYTRTGANDFIMVYTSSYVRVYLGANVYTINTTAITQNEWLHIVGTFDFISDKWQLYVNNNWIGTVTTMSGTIPDGTYQINLFVDQDGATSYNQYFDGEVSSIKFYNRIINREEITKNFHAYRGRFGI